MRKGYLTVYLSLTLAVLVSFVLTLVEGARMNATRMRAICVADVGIDSTLSEYSRELFEQYDLLFVDMGYGSADGYIGTVHSHLQNYLRKNLDDGTPALSRDLLGMKLESATVEEYALATDNDAEAVRRQVADYMDTTLKGKLISGFDDLTEDLVNAGYDYDVESLNESAREQLSEAQMPMEEDENGEMHEIALNNPADFAESTKSAGVLAMVLTDTSGISTTKIDSSIYVSNRKIQKADGISEEEKKVGRSAGKLTYNEYLFDKLGYYKQEKDNSLLSYEIEYVIKNKESDWDNLESVCRTLLLWREGANFTYLMTDEARKSEVKALAAGLAAVVGMPELEDTIMITLLAAWSYVESLQDLRILLEGDGVPVAKTNEYWHTSFSDILFPRSALRSYPGQSGAKYGDYLQTMLMMTSYGKVVAKSMDVMEMDVRKAIGNDNFRMDCCMQSFLVDIVIKSSHGHKAEIRRRSGYYYY